MKKFTIELDNDLAAVYEGIAKINHTSTEEALQTILKRVIETIVKDRSTDHS